MTHGDARSEVSSSYRIGLRRWRRVLEQALQGERARVLGEVPEETRKVRRKAAICQDPVPSQEPAPGLARR